MLISSGIVDRRNALATFFENTYFWYLLSEKNPANTQRIISSAEQAIDWLIGVQLVEEHDEFHIPTPLGKAIAESGLLPTTAIAFVEVLAVRAKELESDFEAHIAGLIHWVCSCEEFRGDNPSRFLIYPIGGRHTASTQFLHSQKLIAPLDRTDDQLNQCAHALSLYVQGIPERQIRFHTNISSGGVHRLSVDVGWVLDGLHRVACVPDLGCSQKLTNQISMLARRVRWGAPAEVLDVIRVAERHRVPGFGRQRAMALLSQGLSTFEDILGTAKDKLRAILKSDERAGALVSAIENTTGFSADRLAKVHKSVAAELGLEQTVEACQNSIGTDYEEAIARLLNAEATWTVTVVDAGKRQNVPDLLGRVNTNNGIGD